MFNPIGRDSQPGKQSRCNDVTWDVTNTDSTTWRVTANTFGSSHTGCDHCYCFMSVDNGSWRSWPKQLEWLKCTSKIFSMLTCYFSEDALRTFFTWAFHCVMCALVGYVWWVQLFLSMPCIIYGVGDFFCGLQWSWYTRYSFICS